MTTKNANVVRAEYTEKLKALFADEDVLQVESGSITFPIVAADGEEGWVEIVVKIPKWTDDDDGYAKAEEYNLKVKERAEREAEKEAAKAKKIAAQEAKKKKKEKPINKEEEES